MAGKITALNGRVNYTLPHTPFIVDDAGYVIGLQHMNGVVTMLPAARWENSITAFAGGGQANAYALGYANARVTTVATAADSVILPVAVPGMKMTVVNAAAANAMAVFPATGDAINALAADASLSVAANKAITFECVVAGRWHSNLTA
jgi:hypothetical protein